MHDDVQEGEQSNKEILVLCHGGPISEPEDAQYILEHTEGIVGFYGASSVERLPTEVAITGCVKKFKGLKVSVNEPARSANDGHRFHLIA